MILLTARAQTRDIVAQGLAAGATDYVPKPFKASDLVARVNAEFAVQEPDSQHPAEAADVEVARRALPSPLAAGRKR